MASTPVSRKGSSDQKAEDGKDEDVMASIRNSLVDAIRHRQNRTEQGELAVRVKLEYAGEKRSIEMKRPVDHGALCAKLRQMYGRPMTMFYTAANAEIIIPIQGQDDLDRAVELLDRTQPGRSLRIILSRLAITDQVAKTPVEHANSLDNATSGRYSPPPGTTPDHQPDLIFGGRNGRRTSICSTKSEGEFIPEEQEAMRRIVEVPYLPSSASSRCSSGRMSIGSYGAGRRYDDPRLPPSDVPTSYVPRYTTRSTISDRSYRYEGLSAKGNTFPSHSAGPNFRQQYNNNGNNNWDGQQQMDGGGGRRTLPRHYRTQLPPRSNGGGARSNSSYGASRASSESGLVPDICDSPECRYCSALDAMSPTAPINWRQGRCLGVGAFGQVYLCYDEDTGRELAVKRVLTSPHNPSQEKEVRTLENEITILRTLHDERVVQYIGCQRDGDSLCIFIEYMPGGSVKDEIRTYGPLKEVVVRKYTHQILEGLNYLHHYDIVHRDIKSANILRDTNGNVKIGDFGAGKRLQTICSQSAAGTFTGTPYYMAPEVINGKSYGRKADIWSLACTIVEMITGNPPWKDLEPMAALFKIATEQPKYILPRSTSINMTDFVSWLFTWDPEKRPAARDALKNTYMALF